MSNPTSSGSTRSIETKVGMLLLVAGGILVAFVLVMSGLSFERRFPVYVDFDNPGGLQTGAPVRLAGVRVGTVDELRFMGGTIDPTTKRRALVRAKLLIAEKVRSTIHQDAAFYVTTQGVLGEQFLAIDPGSLEQPVMDYNVPTKGIDPARLDLFFSKAYELLNTTVTALNNNRALIGDMAANAAGLLKGLNIVVNDNRERLTRTLENLENTSKEATLLVKDARGTINDPRTQRTLSNIDKITTSVQRDSEPLLKSAKSTLENLDRATEVFGGTEEQKKLRKALVDLVELIGRANATAADIQSVVSHVKKGQGTIGALVMDEEIYDDIQEMVRDLKHNPWKFLWRE